MAIKLQGGGGKAFMAWPLVEDFFCAASLTLSVTLESMGNFYVKYFRYLKQVGTFFDVITYSDLLKG